MTQSVQSDGRIFLVTDFGEYILPQFDSFFKITTKLGKNFLSLLTKIASRNSLLCVPKFNKFNINLLILKEFIELILKRTGIASYFPKTFST